MTAPNRATLWGRVLIDELVKAGITAVAFAPGSRSTPLTVAAAQHEGLTTYSHLDERSCAFFALGRARRTGEPTAIVCTSGTAAANFHAAVIEADQARVPMVVLTADRPPELTDTGANQTIDQEKLYGDAVRWYRDLPEPEAEPRKLRSLRTAAGRAVAKATGTPRGPVHLNVRFRKPLEPTPVEGAVPEDLTDRDHLAAEGRGTDPYVRTTRGRPIPDDADLARLADALDAADRGLIVAGPADPPVQAAGSGDGTQPTGVTGPAIGDLAAATGFPLLADPLSGLRWGEHSADPTICGGYDGYVGGLDPFDPDLVIRFGASPTSKPLRHALRGADARQFVVDPAAGWREAEFTASDLVVADAGVLAETLAERVDLDREEAEPRREWRSQLKNAERTYWNLVDEARTNETFEGQVLATVAEEAPDPTTVFVSNSMPVRDLDRFGRPHERALTVLGNRGASGIDGIVSTALGAGSATDDHLTLVTGDLAYYHDTNGLLAIGRCDVDATVVVINNDGGGIFHILPIEEFDPPFTEAFKTPHGLDFEATGDLYDLDFHRVDPDEFADAYRDSVDSPGSDVIEVDFDAEANHRTREAIQERAHDRID